MNAAAMTAKSAAKPFVATDKNSGPCYPAMPALAKHRQRAARYGSIAAMPRADVEAYAAAVDAGIRALNKATQRTGYNPRPNCASGSWANNDADLKAAIYNRQMRELHASVAADRRARTDDDIREAYELAMAEKRAMPVVLAFPAPVAHVEAPAPYWHGRPLHGVIPAPAPVEPASALPAPVAPVAAPASPKPARRARQPRRPRLPRHVPFTPARPPMIFKPIRELRV